MQTTESNKAFYSTMKKVFQNLSDNNEKIQDELLLKIDSEGKFYFDFESDDADVNKAVEIRFKRDRGLNEAIEKKLFGDQKGDLTDSQIAEVNTELLKITPEQTFYDLVQMYSLYEMLLPEDYTEEQSLALDKKYKDVNGKQILEDLKKEYTIQDVRKYMVIKDAIKMQSYEGYRAVTIANNIKRDTAFIIYQKLLISCLFKL